MIEHPSNSIFIVIVIDYQLKYNRAKSIITNTETCNHNFGQERRYCPVPQLQD